jgi:hypothetical protein
MEDGNGLIAGQGFYFRGIKGRREFHAYELSDLFSMVILFVNIYEQKIQMYYQ